MWRYLSYSPENRQPLRHQEYGCLESTVAWRVRAERMKPDKQGEPGVLSFHHCFIPLIVKLELLGPNKLVRPLTQADILSSQCKANPRSRYGDPGRTD